MSSGTIILQMPVGFGTAAGPRQPPAPGNGYEPGPTRARRYGVRFLTDRDMLQRLLPPGLTINGDANVSVEFAMLTDIAWLAGRGYNLVSVRVPVIFDGRDGRMEGYHLAVVWENRTEPIITGREQLGWPKIYAELPDPHSDGDAHHCAGMWDGHRFLTLELTTPTRLEGQDLNRFLDPARGGHGSMVHKYIPRTGKPWTEADADYFTLGPNPGEGNAGRPADAPRPVVRLGTGRVDFHAATWAQMPTQFHIVNALAALPQWEQRGAWMVESLEYDAWLDQRVIG